MDEDWADQKARLWLGSASPGVVMEIRDRWVEVNVTSLADMLRSTRRDALEEAARNSRSDFVPNFGPVVELPDTLVLGASARKGVRVELPPGPPTLQEESMKKPKPRCKCGNICAYYGAIGGYSVQCIDCNARAAAGQRRRRALKRTEQARGEMQSRSV